MQVKKKAKNKQAQAKKQTKSNRMLNPSPRKKKTHLR